MTLREQASREKLGRRLVVLETDVDVLLESVLFLGRGRESGCLNDKPDRKCALCTARGHQCVRSICASGVESDGYIVPSAIPSAENFWKYMMLGEEAQMVLEVASVQPHVLSAMSEHVVDLVVSFLSELAF